MKAAILVSITFLFSIYSHSQSKNSKPFVMGVVDELYSKELKEKRILNIYLPEGYSKNDTLKYPIVYLLDGSANEDFIHVAGLYQFNSFDWVDRAPKSIIIGVATVDRKKDYTYPTSVKEDKEKYPTTGHSESFIAFIEKELQPFIEKNYKANNDKTIIGQSLGGLFATEIILKKPQLFNRYIIISPSLWWDNGSILNLNSDILESNYTRKTSIYIGVGKEGLAPTKIPRVMEVDANILADKLKGTKSKAVNVYFDYLPQEDHATISHQAIANALRFLYTRDK